MTTIRCELSPPAGTLVAGDGIPEIALDHRLLQAPVPTEPILVHRDMIEEVKVICGWYKTRIALNNAM